MGGALAVLIAMDFTLQFPAYFKTISVFTFGAPRVVRKVYLEHLDESKKSAIKQLSKQTFQWRTPCDIVPKARFAGTFVTFGQILFVPEETASGGWFKRKVTPNFIVCHCHLGYARSLNKLLETHG